MSALRSGKYQQVVDTLAVRCSDGMTRYCCEGVAFERYHEQLGYGLRWSTPKGRMISINSRRNGAEDIHLAPLDFWHDMGMLDTGRRQFRFVLPEGCTLRDYPERGSVRYAELNDAGFTFGQIADLIEWQFLGSVEVDVNE